MGSGMAKGAAARGRLIAFGDGKRIHWSPQAHEIYKNNPNVAKPGSEALPNLEWIKYYRGSRIYGVSKGGRWIWNHQYRAIPGELYFTPEEKSAAQTAPGFILIEPSVKKTAPNKQWPRDRYAQVAARLLKLGYPVAQFAASGPPLALQVRMLKSTSFRNALAFLTHASLYIGPEGGLHHGAAAFGIPGVVIFGGFIAPWTTGYDLHRNIFTGGHPCGITMPCPHCRAAMAAISVDRVVNEALTLLQQAKVDNAFGQLHEAAAANG